MTAYSGRKNRTFCEVCAKENDTPTQPGPRQAVAANHMLHAAGMRRAAAAQQKNPALHTYGEKAESLASGGRSPESPGARCLSPTLAEPPGHQRWPPRCTPVACG